MTDPTALVEGLAPQRLNPVNGARRDSEQARAAPSARPEPSAPGQRPGQSTTAVGPPQTEQAVVLARETLLSAQARPPAAETPPPEPYRSGERLVSESPELGLRFLDEARAMTPDTEEEAGAERRQEAALGEDRRSEPETDEADAPRGPPSITEWLRQRGLEDAPPPDPRRAVAKPVDLLV